MARRTRCIRNIQKKLQAKIALGKVVDNSIAPTECTKARCFDTPNRIFFTDKALTALPRWGAL